MKKKKTISFAFGSKHCIIMQKRLKIIGELPQFSARIATFVPIVKQFANRHVEESERGRKTVEKRDCDCSILFTIEIVHCTQNGNSFYGRWQIYTDGKYFATVQCFMHICLLCYFPMRELYIQYVYIVVYIKSIRHILLTHLFNFFFFFF